MSLTTAPALSPAQMAALARIQHYRTRYEIEIVRPDGVRALLCYSDSKAKKPLMAAIGKRGAAVVAFLGAPADAEMKAARGSDHIAITGGGIIRPSGRTQRDTIMEDRALPYVGTFAPKQEA